MLQEWLEELAEDEMKKTASSKLEEGLSELSVDELKGFLSIDKEATQFQIQAPEKNIDPELGRRRGRAAGAAVGGVTGAGIGGSLGGAPGALLGATVGGLGGALYGGHRGAKGAQGRQDELRGKARIMDEIQMERMKANKGAMDQWRSEMQASKAQAALPPGAEASLAKGASDKFAMAANAGRNLAHTITKQAQAPGQDPFAPRMVQANPVDREQFIQESADQGRIGGRVLGGMGGAGLGALGLGSLGGAIGGEKGKLIGALGGAALGAVGGGYGGARVGQGRGRSSAMRLSDDEMQASRNIDLASELYDQGRISDEEMELAEQQLHRGPAQGSLVPQAQQIPVMPRAAPQPLFAEQEKTSSFRDAIIKAASKGAITRYEWEL